MSKKVDDRVEYQLSIAESEQSCLVAFRPAERRALARRVNEDEGSDEGLVTPFPGMYARRSTWKELEPDEQALWVVNGAAALHPRWAFCNVSAALVYGLGVAWDSLGKLHVASTSSNRAASTELVERHYVSHPVLRKIEGVLVTDLMDTVFDCLRTLPRGQALAIADSALARMGGDAQGLVEKLAASYRGYKGVAKALDVAALADARSENPGESIARETMISLGYAVPDLQFEIPDPLESYKTYRVDFAWLDDGGAPLVFGELDGYRKTANAKYMGGRSAEQVLADERRRESRITAYGVPVARFSLAEAKNAYRLDAILDRFGVPRVV